MIVWLVRDLDPLPLDGKDRRPMRSGLLARALSARGHEVHWFTSSFDHYRKADRGLSGSLPVDDRLTLQVLPARGYRGNVSPARILHNRRFAKHLIAAARTMAAPDLIVADIPTTEAAKAAVALAGRLDVPSVVSIRDLWPDFFLQHVPRPLRPLARPALAVLERQARFACANATAVIGVSEGYLRWGQAKGKRQATGFDRVFPLGYAHKDADPAPLATTRRRLDLPPDAHIVAYVGSWGATYDLELVAEAARLLSGHPDIHFVIAGDPAQRPDLARRLGALPNVTLTGWIGSGAIAALLETACLGLLPYRGNAPQGLPNKVFEYMAHGVYQLATLGGELGDLLEETGAGTALPGANPARLAQAITALAGDPSVSGTREERRAIFTARYSAAKVYEAYCDHLEIIASAWQARREPRPY